MPDSPLHTAPDGSIAVPEPFDANALLARVWQQNAHIMQARRERLAFAATEAARGALTAELRTEARDLAHKMAGSLGMFGYHEGTLAAQKLEVLLDTPGAPDAAEFTELTEALRRAMPV